MRKAWRLDTKQNVSIKLQNCIMVPQSNACLLDLAHSYLSVFLISN